MRRLLNLAVRLAGLTTSNRLGTTSKRPLLAPERRGVLAAGNEDVQKPEPLEWGGSRQFSVASLNGLFSRLAGWDTLNLVLSSIPLELRSFHCCFDSNERQQMHEFRLPGLLFLL
jgi:hypothetical protein